ncbi:MAG: class SAM-dependent methyltransferase [Acidimicrobiales bacterium]|nr:class SAM-dependent methyltransferase [Acidimicrobiales bacterium]
MTSTLTPDTRLAAAPPAPTVIGRPEAGGPAGSIRPIAVRPIPPKATLADRAARRLLRSILDGLVGGRLTIVEPDGTTLVYGRVAGVDDLEVTVRLRTLAVWREVVTKGSSGMGESYFDGWWETDGLTAFVQLCIRNISGLDRLRSRWDAVTAPAADAARRLRRPDKARDRRNIQAHYDLGNDFFQLFLDPTMSYSCALFEGADVGLETAQRRKLDRLCQLLDLGPDDHLLEIGTGWGGLAVHAAMHYGARVTTTTISDEQHRYAVDLVDRLGLGDRVEVLLSDYRDLRGTYDKLVSVEMIEAVDWRDHEAYFATCARLLRADGRMALQAITVPDGRFERAKTSEDFIKRFVFPGACLPSVEAINRASAKGSDLTMTQLDEFPRHYAETLARWHQNLDDHADEARALGYGEAFLRLWAFYLSYCEAAYRERYVSLIECVLAKPAWKPSSLQVRP